MKRWLVSFALTFVFLIGTAQAQTTPTFGEKAVGESCGNLANGADFDTLFQCNTSAASGGLKQKAPLFVGAVTSPPYAATTCDANKEGMIQYNGSNLQYCDGTTWQTVGTGSSTGAGQSIVAGWPDVLLCNVTNPNWGFIPFYPVHFPLTTSGERYYRIIATSPAVDYSIRYTSAGAFSGYDNIVASDCNVSIATLVSTGKAFNIVNGGGGVNEMADGTAGAPGLYFTADPNTGFYRPTTDTVAIATNGTEKLRVDASGNVGIGTTTPAGKLTVQGSADLPTFTTNSSFGNILNQGGVYTAGKIIAMDFKPSDYAVPFARIGMKETDSGSYLQFGTSNVYATGITNTAMTIDPSGNVGIGTASPGQKLTVAGTIESTSGGVKFPDGTTQATAALGGGLYNVTAFASSGTWTKPAGVTRIKVTVTGGGGGGGGDGGSCTPGGGGAGGTAIRFLDVTAISSVSVTVGAGGTGNTGHGAGTAGGNSSFGAYGTGYGGGAGNSANTAGTGGSSTAGTVGIPGGNGGVGSCSGSHSKVVDGGSSIWGSAPAYGAGGKGTQNGAQGIVYIEEYK